MKDYGKSIRLYEDGKETFNKIVEVGKNLQAENKTRVGGDAISDIDELRDTTKKDLEKLFADIANDYREAEQEKIKEILQDYAKKLRACTTKDEIALLDAVNKAKTDIDNLKLKTKAEYEAEETASIDTSGNYYKEWEELYWDANMFDGHDVKRICNGKAFISPGISQGGGT